MPTASHRQPLHSLYRRPQALRPASAYPPRQQQHNLGPSYNVATHEVRLHSSRCLSQHFLCRSSHLYLDLGAGHLQVRRWDVCIVIIIIIISRSRTLFLIWWISITNGTVLFWMGWYSLWALYCFDREGYSFL